MEPAHSACGCSQECASFWAPDPSDRRPLRDLARDLPPRFTAGALALALAALPASGAHAASPLPPPPAQDQDLESLLAEADALAEEYNGELRDMEAITEKAENAAARAEATQEDVEEAREQVQQLAIASYQGGGLDPALTIFVDANPQDVIDRAVLVEHLSSTNQDKIDELLLAMERDETAQANAEEQLEEFETDLQELKDQREEVQQLIADYPEQEQRPPYNLTPRTEQMREIIIEEFGEGPGVGCYRPNGGYVVGEHPFGRACDFMMTNDGVMPPEDEIQRGWDIAEYARDNADRLGVMYVIYRQQIWDVRRGDTDWRPMADRGSITENHFDHVHISMF